MCIVAVGIENMDLDEAVSPIEHLKSIFDLCDEDHDGVISVNEFRLLCHQHLGAATQVSDTTQSLVCSDYNARTIWRVFCLRV